MTAQKIFDITCEPSTSPLHLIGVPWEGTVSYGTGTSKAPQAIIDASSQIDLYDPDLGLPCSEGVYFHPIAKSIKALNLKAIELRTQITNSTNKKNKLKLIKEANKLGKQLNAIVETKVTSILETKKIIGIVGGEHSVPLGAYKAISHFTDSFSILQIDAHADLRKSYEGYNNSHASIMYNALSLVPNIETLVQVGIRDFCEEEFLFLQANKDRIYTFYDSHIAKNKYEGISWKKTTEAITKRLTNCVWISLDIDGLDPSLCPNTGTPVPGGLSFNETIYLIKQLVLSGKTIIGFDLCEVSPAHSSEWDANVAMRMLYKLCSWTLNSQKHTRNKQTI